MRKWLKNWWFSIAMFLFAIGLTIYIIISSVVEDYDYFILTLLLISAFTPILIFLLLGIANVPRKEKNNEAILISIKPKYVSMILNKVKTIEVRKRFPSDYVGWVYIYMCQDHKRDWYYCKELGCYFKDVHDHDVSFEAFKDLRPLNAKVIARFWCDKVVEFYDFDDDLCEQACLDRGEMLEYLGDKKGCAIHITNLEIFDKPRELSEFKRETQTKFYSEWQSREIKNYKLLSLSRAPQSFCFIEL